MKKPFIVKYAVHVNRVRHIRTVIAFGGDKWEAIEQAKNSDADFIGSISSTALDTDVPVLLTTTAAG